MVFAKTWNLPLLTGMEGNPPIANGFFGFGRVDEKVFLCFFDKSEWKKKCLHIFQKHNRFDVWRSFLKTQTFGFQFALVRDVEICSKETNTSVCFLGKQKENLRMPTLDLFSIKMDGCKVSIQTAILFERNHIHLVWFAWGKGNFSVKKRSFKNQKLKWSLSTYT